ncbi:hypothetical protein [Bifidobacterium crudilactis]|uniref:hypothetical protein n=1 Tax=Bifidobacterium crudilactis TaxID=327277 RepID=UPI0023568E21|nr:hypothetical protein [Bifidobacterium crudilactis]MCI1218693.1 hypothetical protein [Bifidobacterium crudilactis]
MFGKQGTAGTYGGASVSGGYKTLAKGAVASVPDADYGRNQAFTKSATTSVAADEALLWADDVVTEGFAFDTNAVSRHSFDSAGSYQSNLATVSDAVGMTNYSSFEQQWLRDAKVEGVCTAAQPVGCGMGSFTQQSDSENSYKAFPLSIGDLNKYFNHSSGWAADANLACPSNTCSNITASFWLRSAYWNNVQTAFFTWYDGSSNSRLTSYNGPGLRPAVRLNLENLLLSADSGDQSQSETGDLRLTFADESVGSLTGVSANVATKWLTVSGTAPSSAGFSSDGFGWKLVPSGATDGRVTASGFDADGDDIDVSSVEDGTYDLYYWAQENGSAVDGWSNRATIPVTQVLTIEKAEQLPLALSGLNVSYTQGDQVTTTLTGGSGTGAVSFVSSNPAVAQIDAATGEITLVGVGSFTVTVNKAGDLRYRAANEYVSDTVTVTRRAIVEPSQEEERPSVVNPGSPIAESKVAGTSGSAGARLARTGTDVRQALVLSALFASAGLVIAVARLVKRRQH